MKFFAAIGTWVKTKEVIVDANTTRQAFSMLALEYGPARITRIWKIIPGGKRKCVYDFLNGFKHGVD
jgi:hypothetical protein